MKEVVITKIDDVYVVRFLNEQQTKGFSDASAAIAAVQTYLSGLATA
jgi:hypothetical protein